MKGFGAISRLLEEPEFLVKFINVREIKFLRFINVSKKWIELVSIHRFEKKKEIPN